MNKIENLVSREAYNQDETGYWKRLPFILGPAFALPMGIASIYISPIAQEGFNEALIVFCKATAISLSFGIIFPLILWYSVKSSTDALYYSDPRLDVPPPLSTDYSYRLVCTLMKNGYPIGGVLYVGKSGLLFVPHKRNPKQYQQLLEIPSLNDISLDLVDPQMNNITKNLSKLFFKNIRPSLRVSSPMQELLFRVPVPHETLTLLKEKTSFFKVA